MDNIFSLSICTLFRLVGLLLLLGSFCLFFGTVSFLYFLCVCVYVYLCLVFFFSKELIFLI